MENNTVMVPVGEYKDLIKKEAVCEVFSEFLKTQESIIYKDVCKAFLDCRPEIPKWGKGMVHMTDRVENPMVLEWPWEKVNHMGVKKCRCLGGPGYHGIYHGIYGGIYGGIFVQEKDAFDYALERCLDTVPSGIHKFEWTEEFKEMLVKWFYSDGNWVKED